MRLVTLVGLRRAVSQVEAEIGWEFAEVGVCGESLYRWMASSLMLKRNLHAMVTSEALGGSKASIWTQRCISLNFLRRVTCILKKWVVFHIARGFHHAFKCDEAQLRSFCADILTSRTRPHPGTFQSGCLLCTFLGPNGKKPAIKFRTLSRQDMSTRRD